MTKTPTFGLFRVSFQQAPLKAAPRQATETSLIVRLIDGALDWADRARSRAELATASDRMLADIGLSRAAAEAEAAKPFWHV